MAVSVRLGPPPAFVKHLFFKSFPEVVLGSPSPGLRERSTQCLESSSKFGVLIVAGQDELIILQANDVLAVQLNAKNQHKKHVDLAEIPYLGVSNPVFGVAPSFVAISHGEEFVAVDTQKNGVPFVLVFNLDQFLHQGGGGNPICEIRASAKEGSRVSGIAWNPGENMGSMVAIICDDGSLQLATVKGQNTVEICSLRDGNAKSMCWSPKGKQLVIGRINGNLSQLKLDLSEAKQIPGPGGGRIPSAIFWSATTQFLINFVVEERDIDFMQLDLVKGAPPYYSSFGDIFVSDYVSAASKCFFVPILPWNAMLCPSNTINDLIVISKGLKGNENWTVADIDDTRRAAIPIDSFSVGATLFLGCEEPVVFNEADTFGPMPVLFTLSDAGALCSASVVNSDRSVGSVIQKVSNPLPPALFTLKVKREVTSTPIPVPVPTYVAPVVQSQTPAAQSPQLAALLNNPTGSQSSSNIGSGFQPPVEQQHKPTQVTQPQKLGGSSILNQNFLSTGLPTPEQVEELKRVVEERRAQGDFHEDSAEGSDYEALCMDVEKFNIRLTSFKTKQVDYHQQVRVRLEQVYRKFEHDVLTGLNMLEDFVGAITETTNCQKEEVNLLKETILSHFTQLEYAKAIAERTKDPKYIQLLRAQSLDPATLLRFTNVLKKFQYVKNQMTECESFFKIMGRETRPLEGAAATQVIYQTLSNHSKILKRLVQDLNAMRSQVGLSKCAGLDDNMDVFQFPSLGYFEKKPVVKNKSSNYAPETMKSDRITLDDLTAGISRVKLDKDSELAGSKPLKITAKKLQVLRKAVSKTVDIDVSKDVPDEEWVDCFKPALKPESRELIRMLDVKTVPPSSRSSSINEKGDAVGFVTKQVSTVSPSQINTFGVANKMTASLPPPVKSGNRTPTASATSQPSMFGIIPPTNIINREPPPPLGADNAKSKPLIVGDMMGTGSPSMFGLGVTRAFGSTSLFEPFGTSGSVSSSQLNVLGSSLGNSLSQSSLLGAPPVSSQPSLFGTSPSSTLSQPSLARTSPVSTTSKPLPVSRTTPVSTTSKSVSSSATSVSGLSTTFQASRPDDYSDGSTVTISPQQNEFDDATSNRPIGLSPQPRVLKPLTLTDAAALPITAAANGTNKPGSSEGSTIFGGSTSFGSLSSSSTFGLSSLGALLTSNSSQSSLFGTPSLNSSTQQSLPSTTPARPSPQSSPSEGTVISVSPKPNLFVGSTISTPSQSSLAEDTAVASVSSQSNLFGALTINKSSQSSLSGGTTVSSTSQAGSLGIPVLSTSVQSSLFGNPPTTTSVQSSLFGNQPTTTSSQSGLFGTPPESTSSQPSLFGAQTGSISSQPSLLGTPTASTSSHPSLFGTPTVSTSTQPGMFGTPSASESGLFGTPLVTTSSQPSLFGVPLSVTASSQPGLFGTPTVSTTSQSSLFGTPPVSASPQPGLFGSSQKNAAEPANTAGSFVSAPVFGGSPAFGSSSPFGSAFGSSTGPAVTSTGFGSSGSGSSIFGGGAAAGANTGVFGSSATGSPGFGSASPFGSLSLGSTTSVSSQSSLFGAPPGTTTSQTSLFGAAPGQTSLFGAPPGTTSSQPSLFGAPPGAMSSQSSIFGTSSPQPTQLTNAPPSGLFSSAAVGMKPAMGGFGNTGGVFGGTSTFGSNSAFGSNSFSSTGGNVTQPSLFGTPPASIGDASGANKPGGFGSAPVFGGTPAFGSTSPFGSAFGSAGSSSTFGGGSTSSSIFGGGAAQQSAPTFGALASAPQSTFGGFGSPQSSPFGQTQSSPFGQPQQSSGFGQPVQQPQQASAFGQTRPAAASFGGSAFNSWR